MLYSTSDNAISNIFWNSMSPHPPTFSVLQSLLSPSSKSVHAASAQNQVLRKQTKWVKIALSCYERSNRATWGVSVYCVRASNSVALQNNQKFTFQVEVVYLACMATFTLMLLVKIRSMHDIKIIISRWSRHTSITPVL